MLEWMITALLLPQRLCQEGANRVDSWADEVLCRSLSGISVISIMAGDPEVSFSSFSLHQMWNENGRPQVNRQLASAG